MAVVAAKGVDLRAPLKPDCPVEPQQTTLPLLSVIEAKVLLKEAVICRLPDLMFLVISLTSAVCFCISCGFVRGTNILFYKQAGGP